MFAKLKKKKLPSVATLKMPTLVATLKPPKRQKSSTSKPPSSRPRRHMFRRPWGMTQE